MDDITRDDCYVFSRFPAPQTIYETFFSPAIVIATIRSTYFNSALLKTVSSFAASAEVNKYVDNKADPKILQYLLELVDSDYTLLSSANWALAVAARSMIIYRPCQLVVLAIQHKIALTNWQPLTKFAVSSFVALIPSTAATVLTAGAVSPELITIAMVRVMLPHLFLAISRKKSNKIKEFDEISVTKNLSLKGFIIQNAFTLMLNVGAVSLLPAWHFLSSNKMMFFTAPVQFEMCRYFIQGNKFGLFVLGEGTTQSMLTLLINEIGWVVGKIVVDALFIGLALIGIVKDLRDPINSIFARAKPYIPGLSVITPKANRPIKTNFPATLPGVAAPEGEKSAFPEEIAAGYRPPPAPRARKKTKGKDKLIDGEKARDEEKLNQLLRVIEIPGTNSQLIKLEGPGLGKNPNVWGMISLNIVENKLGYFTRCLATSHVGKHNSSIASLKNNEKKSDGGKKSAKYYELRPTALDERILGRLIRGEADIYERLKEILPYEVALEVILKMKENRMEENKDINFIDFSRLANHKNIPQKLAKL